MTDRAPQFEAFRRQAIADERLFSLLLEAPDSDAFVALAERMGRERGLAFSVRDVQAALQSARRSWIERDVRAVGGAAPAVMRPHPGDDDDAPLVDWTPINVSFPAEGPRVEWCRLGRERFIEPFFEQTIARVLRSPARLAFGRETSVEHLETFGVSRVGLPPSGFIFHLSRCGSTLMAQMLAAPPHSVVISEAPPLDQILSAQQRDSRVTRKQRIAWLRGMVGALGQRRSGAERNYFIKFDSWHVLELPLILEAFPEVPWVFLYRDPLEVLVSQHRQRGTQMVPGMVEPRWFGFDAAEVARMSLDDYCARVLGKICGAALEHAELGRGHFVNFTQLPQVMWESLGKWFDVAWSAEDVGRMQEAAQRNAKTPSLPHADDREAKQREATDELRELERKWLSEPYARLEARRERQNN